MKKEMKNIYSILMTLAAAFLLAPATYAQSDPDHEKYEKYPAKHVGLNKYLKNTTPNEDGEYILRLETFTTGAVTKHAVPTDFVLVIDCSGSMLEDCLYGKTRPESVTQSQLDDPEDQYYHFLRPAHSPENLFQGISHYTYDLGYKSGNIGQAGSGNATTWSYFTATATSPSSSLYYYYEPDDTYYKINEEYSGGHYRIFFTRTNGLKRYVVCTQNGSTITTTTSETAQDGTYNNASNKVILIGYEGDNIYRPVIRTEELIPAYKAFIQSIYDHNQTDPFAEGVKKHQVSVVAFGDGLTGGNVTNPNLTPSTSYSSATRVVKGFDEISAGNVAGYKSAIDDYFSFRAGTATYLGVLLARKLLERLQGQANMAPLNSLGGTNRNKVVVFFTDGAPKKISDTGSPKGGTIYNNVRLSLQEARLIKAARTSVDGTEINGKLFSINFADNEHTARFIEYMSSNYPDAAATGATNTGDISTFTYSGTLVPEEERIYYFDANASGQLENAFKAIADASTGDTGAHMVAVDAVSDSFALPEDIESAGKVKLFTAQCVGVKTIDGEEYLAFTDDVPVASRPALEELWFNSVDEHGDVTWEKKTGLDIDKDVKCVIDGKTLVFKGFDFAGLWCGKDDDPDHHNTQQITEGMKNFGIADPQYRGFKLIAEFPIIIDENALGGPDVPTNIYDLSGLFPSDESGTPSGSPIVNYPKPQLTIPIKLVIQKSGLAQGESASFTIERKLIGSSDPYTLFTTFVLTGAAAGENNPEVRFVSLDPRYYYRVRETGWSWAYEQADPSFLPSTENPNLGNPIVFDNDPDEDTPRHAEAKAVNRMRSFSSSTTTTIHDVVR
jgi:hypothetical protein